MSQKMKFRFTRESHRYMGGVRHSFFTPLGNVVVVSVLILLLLGVFGIARYFSSHNTF